MSFDYGRMRDTATRLLTRFNQGDLATVTVTTTEGAGPFDAPSEVASSVTRQGVSKGVSSKYVDGVNILSTDLELTLEPIAVDVGSRVSVDGKPMTVLRVMQVPPSGVSVVTRLIVRG